MSARTNMGRLPVLALPWLLLAAGCLTRQDLGNTDAGPGSAVVDAGTQIDASTAGQPAVMHDAAAIADDDAGAADASSAPCEHNVELCNDVDDDCDGQNDEGLDCSRSFTAFGPSGISPSYTQIHADADGSVYASGVVRDTATVGDTVVTAPADRALQIVASFDADGTPRWVRSFEESDIAGGPTTALGTELLYVLGGTDRGVDLETTGGTVRVDGMFIAALELDDGRTRWATPIDLTAPVGRSSRLAVDAGGNVYFAASVPTDEPSGYDTDIHYGRLAPGGDLSWVHQALETHHVGAAYSASWVNGLAVSADGNPVIALSTYAATITFDTCLIGDTTMRLLSLDSQGACLWVADADYGAADLKREPTFSGLAVRTDGSILAVASTHESFSIGGIPVAAHHPDIPFHDKDVVLSLTAEGKAEWVWQREGDFSSEATSVALDTSGRAYVGLTVETTASEYFGFVVSLDRNGKTLAQYDASAVRGEGVNALAVLPNGNPVAVVDNALAELK